MENGVDRSAKRRRVPVVWQAMPSKKSPHLPGRGKEHGPFAQAHPWLLDRVASSAANNRASGITAYT